MSVRLSVKRKFIVNGTEYNSVSEMPEKIRNALERHISTPSNKKSHLSTTRSKIVFNNHEYANTDEMPQHVREKYQEALQVAGLTEAVESPNEVSDFSMRLQAQKAIVPSTAASGKLRVWILIGGLISIPYLLFFF